MVIIDNEETRRYVLNNPFDEASFANGYSSFLSTLIDDKELLIIYEEETVQNSMNINETVKQDEIDNEEEEDARKNDAQTAPENKHSGRTASDAVQTKHLYKRKRFTTRAKTKTSA